MLLPKKSRWDTFHIYHLNTSSWLWTLIAISDQHGVNKDGKIPYCALSMFATKEFIQLHPLATFLMVVKDYKDQSLTKKSSELWYSYDSVTYLLKHNWKCLSHLLGGEDSNDVFFVFKPNWPGTPSNCGQEIFSMIMWLK